MTEIYNSYFDPMSGDKPKPVRYQDDYHPKYPEVSVSTAPQVTAPKAEVVGYDCSANKG